MDVEQRETGFDIRGGRAMVSLGPLSPRRYCAYSCAFCYVQADFPKYPSLSIAEILAYLNSHAGEYDIVYVSGDTDSFAPPRTAKGLDLLDALSELRTDLMFTTRAPLEEAALDRLGGLGARLNSQGHSLFGCISIPRLRSAPHLEPSPVPSPERRLEVLSGLHSRGIVSVLTLRPFLPVVPPEEYVELVRLAAEYTDVVLGEVWFADMAGVLEKRVFAAGQVSGLTFEERRMDFDSNEAVWKVWQGAGIRNQMEAYCRTIGIPFFMRSRPAVLHIREMRNRRSQ